jgi:hypothetical protein
MGMTVENYLNDGRISPAYFKEPPLARFLPEKVRIGNFSACIHIGLDRTVNVIPAGIWVTIKTFFPSFWAF